MGGGRMTQPPATPEPTDVEKMFAANLILAIGGNWRSEANVAAIAEAIARARLAGGVAERERCARFVEHKSRHTGDVRATFLMQDLAAAIRSLAPAEKEMP